MFQFMSRKRILCVVRYFAGEQHTIRLVFSLALRCRFFYLSPCSVLLHLYSCVFLSFLFLILIVSESCTL